jgi:hypothetical protein
MKTKITTCLVVLIFLVGVGHSQGFLNLDFESANVSGYPNPSFPIPASNAFPGWTVVAPYTAYDDVSLSGGSISIFDLKPPYSLPPIQGTYFVWMFGSGTSPNYGTISLGQTGQVPIGTQSISFWGLDTGLQITFGGQLLNFVETGTTGNYNIYTADISAYADQTGLLLLSAPVGSGNNFIDNIQFSSSPIPEPSVLSLCSLCALFLCWLWERPNNLPEPTADVASGLRLSLSARHVSSRLRLIF